MSRRVFIPFIFFLFADLMISGILAALSNEYSRWPTFFISLAVLWLLPIALGAWGLIKFWLAYHLFLKRQLVRYYKAQMHEHEFPKSKGHYDNQSYLSFVLDDDPEYSSQKAKMKAAFFVGEFAAYKSLKAWTMGIAFQSAFEQAMEEYTPERTR